MINKTIFFFIFHRISLLVSESRLHVATVQLRNEREQRQHRLQRQQRQQRQHRRRDCFRTLEPYPVLQSFFGNLLSS